jgi:hypothetical protein
MNQDSILGKGKEFCFPPQPPYVLLGSPCLRFNRYRDFFSGYKATWHEANHLSPYNIEIKNAWGSTFIPLYVLMTWCLIKPRDNLPLSHHVWYSWLKPQSTRYLDGKWAQTFRPYCHRSVVIKLELVTSSDQYKSLFLKLSLLIGI